MLACPQHPARNIDLVGLVAQCLDRRAGGNAAVQRQRHTRPIVGRALGAPPGTEIALDDARPEAPARLPLRHLGNAGGWRPQYFQRPCPMWQSSQESALLKRLDEPVNTGLGLEIDRFLHFLERRSDAALIKIGVDEKQEFLLFPGQHRQTPQNRTKGKPSAYVLVWFALPVKRGLARSSAFSLTAAGLWPTPPRGRRGRGLSRVRQSRTRPRVRDYACC